MRRIIRKSERAMIAKAVGIAAIKFADLSNNRVSSYIFDLERFTRFEGKTGPYLQYAAVRIKSILRKAREEEYDSALPAYSFGRGTRAGAATSDACRRRSKRPRASERQI